MLLALDIGNSTMAAALFDDEKTVAELNVSSTVQRSPDETWGVILSFLSQNNFSPENISGIGIASVVPFLTKLFTSLFLEKAQLTPLVINGSTPTGISIKYSDPSQLGADRICSAVAAYGKFGGPLIVIDFGTATTYGAIDSEGNFLGGSISLGIQSTAEALFRRTAQLPEFSLQLPSSPICKDTISAMQAGTVFPAIDAVEGMITRIKRELGGDAKVVATGGLSPFMSKHTTMIDHYEPSLVLEGIRTIYRKNHS